jgi:outer membrane protein OmpA-like peptidoglycan-associated protein
MTDARRLTPAYAILAAALLGSCGPQRVRPPAPDQHRGGDLIVLLPDPQTGNVGRATVSNSAGKVDLAAARDSTQVSRNQAPLPVATLSEAEVRQMFDETLAALPPPPEHFTLYFLFDSDELTPQSRALVPRILQAVGSRPVPDVLVIGHTDTTGTPATNFALGLRRATTVRALLIEAGLDASFVEVASHGKADLLIATADGVAEPRNRRVEITVR